MKKIILLAFVLLLLWPMTVIIHFSAPVKAEPTTWTVDDDKPADFSSIQEAINSPDVKDGDTVFVHEGTYQECNVVLDKNNLSLVGENKNVTVIDGGSCYNWLLTITAQNVTVTGFTIQNSHDLFAGVFLNHATRSKISNNIIKNHDSGVYSAFSDGNVIEDNWVANSKVGIILSTVCKENKIRDNTVTGNTLFAGIYLSNGAHDNEIVNNNILQNKYGISISSDNNSIFGNQIVNNKVGIYGDLPTYGYRIFHNNFINNTKQIDLHNQSINIWDNGYPSGGNYWSDYNGTDLYSGAYLNQTGGDGIGDSLYIINGNNTDRYPLMGTFSEFPVVWEEESYHVTTVCNSTISGFQFGQTNKMIRFDATGEEGAGFCRATIPKVIVQDFWSSNHTVLVDGEETATNNWTDNTHVYIYFTYQHPEHEIEIVSELPTWASILLIFIVPTIAIIIHKRRLHKTSVN